MGQPFFDRLVDRFYDGVEADDVLLPLYPDHADLVGARRRLALFLGQYWGGPTTYSDERGHPRLRARHFPFSIGAVERDRWLLHMREAIDETDAPAGRQGAAPPVRDDGGRGDAQPRRGRQARPGRAPGPPRTARSTPRSSRRSP